MKCVCALGDIYRVSEGMKSIYDVQFDVEHMAALIEKIEARVEKWFFDDAFKMLDRIEVEAERERQTQLQLWADDGGREEQNSDESD